MKNRTMIIVCVLFSIANSQHIGTGGFADFTIICKSDGKVYTWGRNNNGQLGNENTGTNSNVPVAVSTSGVLSGKIITQVATGEYHSIALASNGTVYSWGYGWYGQLGNNSTATSNVPVAVYTSGVLNGKTITQVAAGSEHSIALASDGTVYTWGRNYYGQLGNQNTGTDSNVPVAVYTSGVLSGKTITQVAAGYQHSIALASDGTVYTWGRNDLGQLGNGNNTDSNVPVAVYTSGVLSGKTITQVAAGYHHSIALASDGTVYTWGNGWYGRLGNGSATDSNVPVAVSTSGVLSGKTITRVAGGYEHSIALASNETVYTWGRNNYGQLGNNSATDSNVPVAVSTSGVLSGKTITQVAAGKNHSIALASDGTVNTWGRNLVGQLGNSNNTDSNVPVQVTNSTMGIITGAYISGTSGFRMMSSPVSGTIYSDLLSELWTQGMTGGDVTTGSANVWTYSGSAWSALSNLSTASLTAGQGFLVYVYANTNNSGADDLPVTLSVSGTANSSSATVPSSGSIANAAWELAGNPYSSTIDWDLITKTNVATTVYVYNNAKSGGAGYISWNGSTGDLSDGLIAPYQGFWVQGSGGSGSITIEIGDKSSTPGTFYKTTSDSSGSITFTITSGSYSDHTFVSFMTNGETGQDNADAWKLLPLTATERIVGLSYIDNQGLDINNLPYQHETEITIPLDVMKLTIDSNNNFTTTVEEAMLTWDLTHLPETVTGLILTNTITNETTDLMQTDNITFTTAAKGSFPAYGSNGVNVYPQIGNSQFTLTITYRTLNTGEQPIYPKEYALHAPYPNPFNPDVKIAFDVPNNTVETRGPVSLQVFNINGQRVETLANNPQPGTHAITWNPKNISSGIYIIQLKTSAKVLNQKITYLK